MMSVALVWLSLACVAGAAIPVIIDTDIGQDFDEYVEHNTISTYLALFTQ